MVGWILLTVFTAGVLWLFWTPLRLEIDTEQGVFRLEWLHLCAVQWLPEEALDALRLQAPFFRRTFYLANRPAPDQAPVQPKPKPARPAQRKKIAPRTMWRLGRNVLRSFKIKRCQVLWDSDDFIWNAQVFPLAHLLSTRGAVSVRINFTGQRELALIVENRLGRILWAVLQTFTTKH